MSQNVQAMDSAGRKRSHDEFSAEAVKVDDHDVDEKASVTASVRPVADTSILCRGQADTHTSPGEFGSPAMTEAGSCTTANNSPSPLTPTKTSRGQPAEAMASATNGNTDSSAFIAPTQTPTSKRTRLTPAEKQAKAKELADRKREREEQAAKKAAQKAKQDEEKAAKTRERVEKRKQKEEEDRLKAEQRDGKRRIKDEEQRRIQEEKNKKARTQPSLFSFFKKPGTPGTPGTPKKLDRESALLDDSPLKATKGNGLTCAAWPEDIEYNKIFKPFFIRDNTKLAPSSIRMDEDTIENLRLLDLAIASQQISPDQHSRPFIVSDLRSLVPKTPKRGRPQYPVKYILEAAYNAAQSTNGADGAASRVFDAARQKLTGVSQKLISFSQDVRPPYYGTITLTPYMLGRRGMIKAARKPCQRRLPLAYDYDSEAEWQDDEGEDIDVDDDEEELDDEDDMDGFLDDSDDTGMPRRMFGMDMKATSTGICFEDQHGLGPDRTIYKHKMEFIQEGHEHPRGIDPFSTQYWEQEPKYKVARATEAKAEKMAPPATTPNAFAALKSAAASAAAPGKLVKEELMNDIKKAILDHRALSKVGIIDFIFHQFRDKVSRIEVRNTVEHVAEKKGAGRNKQWDLKPGHEIPS